MKHPEIRITSKSADETRIIGENLGRCISSGILITLTGDLGSGKTAFVQGLAKGLEVSEKYYITSPTYTIINEYPGRIPLFHVDLYRLSDGDDFENIGLYDIIHNQHVVAIEWAEKLAGETFPEMLCIALDIGNNDTRTIIIKAEGPGAENVIQLLEEYL
jgi:tRNA threonylcarbamoyladenosine biosynthesis protein TsaE